MTESRDSHQILDKNIQTFIREHEDGDVKALALQKLPNPNWPRPEILNQIKARQKAASKLPTWHKTDGIIFPHSDVIEQASSEAAATYKASLVSGKNFADLTAGAGVDTYAFSRVFSNGYAIEINAHSANILTHNLNSLKQSNINVINESSEVILETLPNVDFIYVDPARRDQSGKGKYNLSSCQPNVISLLPLLLKKAKTVMVKTSPILDISKAYDDLNGHVSECHIVEWDGQVKEILLILSAENKAPLNDIPIHAIQIDNNGKPTLNFEFTLSGEEQESLLPSKPLKYLYEPRPALMKSGAFNLLSNRTNTHKIQAHTHLYTSAELNNDFPGRAFEIQNVIAADKKSLKSILPDGKANLSLRNFPMPIDALKKKFGIKDGGQEYLFACTLNDGKHVLIHCRKV